MIEKGNFDVKEADIVYYQPWLDGRVLGRTKPGPLVMEVVSVCEQTGTWTAQQHHLCQAEFLHVYVCTGVWGSREQLTGYLEHKRDRCRVD